MRTAGLVVTALLVGLGIAGVLLAEFAESHSEGVIIVSGGLATSNRPGLSICVDGAGGASPTALDMQDVSDMVDAIFAGDRYPGVYPSAFQVVEGCPVATGLTGRILTRSERHFAEGGAARVFPPSEPSEHRVFVYFVTPSMYADSFGMEPFATATAEFLCFDTQCAAVTTSLYVALGTSQADIQSGVLDALGLGLAVEDPPRSPEEVQERRIRELTPESIQTPTSR